MPQLDSFVTNDLSSFPSSLLSAIGEAPLPDIGDGPPAAGLAKQLEDGAASEWTLADPNRSLCTSGLWLLAGDLDSSHTISQNIGSAEGSFWHGIMHRREGDFGNSKYWFRKVGNHPVFEQLAELSDGIYSDPFDFVDLCSRLKRSGDESYQRCQRAQWLEWQALMAYCITM
jgi:hypothetical protein